MILSGEMQDVFLDSSHDCLKLNIKFEYAQELQLSDKCGGVKSSIHPNEIISK